MGPLSGCPDNKSPTNLSSMLGPLILGNSRKTGVIPATLIGRGLLGCMEGVLTMANLEHQGPELVELSMFEAYCPKPARGFFLQLFTRSQGEFKYRRGLKFTTSCHPGKIQQPRLPQSSPQEPREVPGNLNVFFEISIISKL